MQDWIEKGRSNIDAENTVSQTTQLASDSNLKAHIVLFSVLVLTNVFVGGMVGLERTILPLIADTDFGIISATAAISFIATFGVTKATVNFFAGSLSTIGEDNEYSCWVGWLVYRFPSS